MVIKLIKKISFFSKPIAKFIISLFMDKDYITGKHYEKSYLGYLWAFRTIWQRNILRLAPPMPWPIALTSKINNPKNIIFHADDINIFQSSGLYLQNFKAKIIIGKGCYIAPNVGIITANHSLDDLDLHDNGEDVILGAKCWIGMNSVILPGVILGNNTIVAAGSVVTKSFEMGNIIIGGVPAKIIKKLDNTRKNLS